MTSNMSTELKTNLSIRAYNFSIDTPITICGTIRRIVGVYKVFSRVDYPHLLTVYVLKHTSTTWQELECPIQEAASVYENAMRKGITISAKGFDSCKRTYSSRTLLKAGAHHAILSLRGVSQVLAVVPLQSYEVTVTPGGGDFLFNESLELVILALLSSRVRTPESPLEIGEEAQNEKNLQMHMKITQSKTNACLRTFTPKLVPNAGLRKAILQVEGVACVQTNANRGQSSYTVGAASERPFDGELEAAVLKAIYAAYHKPECISRSKRLAIVVVAGRFEKESVIKYLQQSKDWTSFRPPSREWRRGNDTIILIDLMSGSSGYSADVLFFMSGCHLSTLPIKSLELQASRVALWECKLTPTGRSYSLVKANEILVIGMLVDSNWRCLGI